MPRLPFLRFAWVIAIALAGFGSAEAGTSGTPPKDIVLILDNSGSMKKNDRGFLVRTVAAQFIREASEDTRLAILIFDQGAWLAASLAPMSAERREAAITSLDQIDYRGFYTNIPEALSQAVQELRVNARRGASRHIVLLTDGVVDTGDRTRDRARTEWLRGTLVAEAARENIEITTVALTAKSDKQLLHYLAEQTAGEYFWAPHAEQLPQIFARIRESIAQRRSLTPEPKIAEPAPVAPAPAVPAPVSAASTPSPVQGAAKASPETARLASGSPSPPATDAAGPSPKPAGTPLLLPAGDERAAYGLIAISVLLLALIVLVTRMLIRSRQPLPQWSEGGTEHRGTGSAPQAFLYDCNEVTGRRHYALTHPITVIGRVPANAEEPIDHIVIDRPTIGRRHAVIERKHYGFWLIDQNSKNGTFLNGERIHEAVCLTHGDRLRFHNVDLEFALTGMGLADKTIAVGELKLLTNEASVAELGSRAIASHLAVRKPQPDETIVERALFKSAPPPLDILDITLPNDRTLRESLDSYLKG